MNELKEKELNPKEALIKSFGDARHQLFDAVAGLPLEHWDDAVVEDWSVKDIFAHDAGWDESDLARAEDFINGREVNFVPEEDEDTFNKKAVSERKQATAQEVFEELTRTSVEIHDFLVKTPAEVLFGERVDTPPFKGEKVTPAWFFYDPQHDVGHANQITAWREKNGL